MWTTPCQNLTPAGSIGGHDHQIANVRVASDQRRIRALNRSRRAEHAARVLVRLSTLLRRTASGLEGLASGHGRPV